MSNDKDRDRDNKTGRFTTDEDADARPDETTSEAVKTDPLKKWFKRLIKDGGAITAAGEDKGETFEAYGDRFVYIAPIKDDASRDAVGSDQTGEG